MRHKPMFLILTCTLIAGQAGADPADCMTCHDVDEFDGMQPAQVKEALSDPGIPPHGRFSELTVEQIEVLLEGLAKKDSE